MIYYAEYFLLFCIFEFKLYYVLNDILIFNQNIIKYIMKYIFFLAVALHEHEIK